MLTKKTTQEVPAKQKMQGRRSRRGTDLFSAVLYLIIFVVVIAGVVAIYSSVMTGVRNVQLQTLVMRTAASVESSYSNFPTYDSGSLLAVIKSRGSFSDSEIYEASGGYKMRTPFNTEMSVTGNGSTNFTITVIDLKESACEKLLENMVDPGRTVKIMRVQSTTLDIPYTNAAISAACSGSSDNLYDVAVTF
jgi:hypothetical protein